MGGWYAADLYSSNYVLGGAYTFHFSEDLALEASFQYTRFHSDARRHVQPPLPAARSSRQSNDKPGMLYFGHLVWSFAYGKLRWMGGGISRFDFNLALGAGVTDDSTLGRRHGQRRSRHQVVLRKVVRAPPRRARSHPVAAAHRRAAPRERHHRHARLQRLHSVRRLRGPSRLLSAAAFGGTMAPCVVSRLALGVLLALTVAAVAVAQPKKGKGKGKTPPPAAADAGGDNPYAEASTRPPRARPTPAPRARRPTPVAPYRLRSMLHGEIGRRRRAPLAAQPAPNEFAQAVDAGAPHHRLRQAHRATSRRSARASPRWATTCSTRASRSRSAPTATTGSIGRLVVSLDDGAVYTAPAELQGRRLAGHLRARARARTPRDHRRRRSQGRPQRRLPQQPALALHVEVPRDQELAVADQGQRRLGHGQRLPERQERLLRLARAREGRGPRGEEVKARRAVSALALCSSRSRRWRRAGPAARCLGHGTASASTTTTATTTPTASTEPQTRAASGMATYQRRSPRESSGSTLQ